MNSFNGIMLILGFASVLQSVSVFAITSSTANMVITSQAEANSTMSIHKLHKFPKRARPRLNAFYPDHCAEAARADKAFKDALLLAGMALRADYDGSSYLRYFHPDQEMKVKTTFFPFFDPPDDSTDEAAWAGSSRFSEAHSFYDDVPQYTECEDDKDLSAYFIQNPPTHANPHGCTIVFCPNGFSGLPDLEAVPCASLETATSYAMDNLAATILHEYLHWNYLVAGGNVNIRAPQMIQDWNNPSVPDADPPSGYGPYYSMRINQLYAQPGLPSNGGARPDPSSNAENYVWFALEEYFKWKCPDHAGGFSDPLPVPAPPNDPLPDHQNPVPVS